MQIQEAYEKNLSFWEDAWQRVSKPYKKLAALDYLEEIPKVFTEYNCQHVLDIACGSGWLSFYLAAHGIKATGVDISESAIALGKKWIAEDKDPQAESDSEAAGCAVTATKGEVRATDQVDLFVADMMDLSDIADQIKSPELDGLLINAAFEHLDYEHGKKFLQQIKKHLKTDAIMYGVFDKVGTGEQGDYIELADGTKQYQDKFRDGMFLRYYPDEELKKLLEETNWQIESWRENELGSRIVVAKNC